MKQFSIPQPWSELMKSLYDAKLPEWYCWNPAEQLNAQFALTNNTGLYADSTISDPVAIFNSGLGENGGIGGSVQILLGDNIDQLVVLAQVLHSCEVGDDIAPIFDYVVQLLYESKMEDL